MYLAKEGIKNPRNMISSHKGAHTARTRNQVARTCHVAPSTKAALAPGAAEVVVVVREGADDNTTTICL